jgi:hypothetical protein
MRCFIDHIKNETGGLLMPRKILFLCLTVMLCISLLTACSDSKPQSAESRESTSQLPSTPTEGAEETTDPSPEETSEDASKDTADTVTEDIVTTPEPLSSIRIIDFTGDRTKTYYLPKKDEATLLQILNAEGKWGQPLESASSYEVLFEDGGKFRYTVWGKSLHYNARSRIVSDEEAKILEEIFARAIQYGATAK